ncbi:hypothetical protein HK414_10275 [Ramlibacter terrae]|uniref:Uncharacterized protein n=1 Tax=Ramlibacter terrae TaxID=2732511 RepID=A0ABX6P244_9BURK|nr:hypothetical protein HK414_10275 [Ramlibacter terrae]
MSRPLHQTLGARYPGAHMVFDQSATCTPVALAQVARPVSVGDVPAGTIRMEGGRRAAPGGSSPLLTDKDTAARQNLPHTVVAGNVVMVPASIAASRASIPSMTVIPSEVAVASARPAPMDTRTMAGTPDTRSMGAGPSGAVRPPTVITEMRDGSTVVQRGGSVAVVR